MGDFLWILPAVVCGGMMVMMVVMMLGMGKSMFSRDKKDEDQPSVEEIKTEQRRLAEQVERLERGEDKRPDRSPTGA